MSFSGFVQAALQLGLSTVLFKPTRGIYNITLDDGSTLPDIIAQATIEEHHVDQLEITEHPVEQGAPVADHAYKRPAEVTLRLGWSNSPSGPGGLVAPAISAAVAAGSGAATAVANVLGAVSAVQGVQSAIAGSGVDQINSIYQNLLQLQVSRALFDLYTGKRVYQNMLCKTLTTETDFKSANALPITMVCQQVILVNSQTVDLPASLQADPSATASMVSRGVQSAVQKSFNLTLP